MQEPRLSPRRLIYRLPERLVEGCFLELRPPTIAQAWQRLCDHGATHAHAVPLLLFSAGHAKQDIPTALAECAAERPELTFDFGRPLSRHPCLLERVCQCVQGALASTTTSPAEETALVMVGRGSYDPCAAADMRLLAECVYRAFNEGRERRFASVDTAFYAMAQPALPDVLQQVAGRAGISQVIVHPHLLFAGQLQNAIARQVATAQEQSPHVRFVLGEPLGPDRLVAAAVHGRMLELEAACEVF